MSAVAVLFSFLAVVAGTLFPVQTAVNARLASVVGGSIPATLISFISGFLALLLLCAITVRYVPSLDELRRQPPWLFVVGGILGATYLSLNVFLVPRIGAGAMMSLAVAGQMLAALTLDATGLFGLAVRDVSPGRLIGAGLVVCGAAMFRLL